MIRLPFGPKKAAVDTRVMIIAIIMRTTIVTGLKVKKIKKPIAERPIAIADTIGLPYLSARLPDTGACYH